MPRVIGFLNCFCCRPRLCKVFCFWLRLVGRRDLSAGLWARVFFFIVAPLCSCPVSLVSRIFFAVGPGCAKCFFLCCAPLGAAGQSKRNTPPSFFLLRPRRKAGEGEAPLGAGTGPEQKNNTTHGWCFFFCSGPAEMSRRPTGRNKEKNHTRGRQQKKFWKPMTRGTSKKGPGPESRRKVAAPNGAQQKKHFAPPGPTKNSRNQ